MRALFCVFGHFLTFFLWPLVLSAQTSIVAVMTSDSIVIGSDSKETTPDGRESTSFCKIGVTKGVVWARAYYARDTGLNYDADATARAAMEAEGSLAERVATFEKNIKPQLKRNIEVRLGNTNYEWFRSRAEGKSVLEILFATFENERPLMLFRKFKAHRAGHGVEIESVPMDCPGACPSVPTILPFGYHETIDNMGVEEKGSLFRKFGLEAGVRYLVEKEVAACPKFVGPPVDVIRIDAHGSHWMSCGNCPQASSSKPEIPTVPNSENRCDEAP